MATTVKQAKLWRAEIENAPGKLAAALEPLAGAGADLQVVMAYRYPGDATRAAVEVYPVAGKKQAAAAQAAGLQPAQIPMLLVEGDNRAGLGARLAQAMAEAGINMSFLVAQVMGRKYSAVFGFENEADAKKGAAVIRRAAAPAGRTTRRRHPR
jgi:hypothetical protein